MKRKPNKIKVTWKDAVIYNEDSARVIELPTVLTTGQLVKKTKDYLLLKNTHSVAKHRKPLLKDKAGYFFIPMGMVQKIETEK